MRSNQVEQTINQILLEKLSIDILVKFIFTCEYFKVNTILLQMLFTIIQIQLESTRFDDIRNSEIESLASDQKEAFLSEMPLEIALKYEISESALKRIDTRFYSINKESKFGNLELSNTCIQ